MDRRDALKKLGMGGAAAIGASMMISSPALAAGGSNNSQPGVGTLTVALSKNPTNNDKAVGSVSIPARPCPFGSTNPARIDYGISGSGTSLLEFVGGVTTYTSPTPPVSNPFVAPISLTWSQQTGRSVTVRVNVRWVCLEANDTDFAWSCQTWDYPFTANNGGTVSAGTPVLISSTCDAP
jgi:hypothetical protein